MHAKINCLFKKMKYIKTHLKTQNACTNKLFKNMNNYKNNACRNDLFVV